MTVTVFRELGYLGADRETTQGTPVAPTKFFKLKKQQFVIDQAFEDIRNGNQRDIANSVKKYIQVQGSFQTFLFVDEGAFLLAHAMGKDVVSGSSDPYTHTLTLLDSLPFSSWESSFFENQLLSRWSDCKIGKLTLAAKAGELATLDVDVMGCGMTVPTAATVTFSDALTDGPLVFAQGVFTLGGPTDAAVIAAQIQSVSLEIDQALQFVRGPNSYTPIYLLETARKFTLKFDAAFSGPNLYQLTYMGANAGTVPSSTVGTGSLTMKFTGAASPEHSISITIPNFSYESAKPEFSPDGKLAIQSVEAIGYRNGATLPMSAVVKNAFATQLTA